MSGSTGEGFDRPIDFSYDACWFECPECGDRVVMTFEDRANGESRTCSAGHEVTASMELHPSLTDLADIATDSAMIERLAWYHTSTHADWPPTDLAPTASST